MNNVRGLYPPLYGAPANGGGGGGGSIQVNTLPEASLDYKDKIVQYTGATTETLTNAYFYKCVETTSYDWEETEASETYTEAETLPTASAETIGTIYKVDDKYYQTVIVLSYSWNDIPVMEVESGGGINISETETEFGMFGNTKMYAKVFNVTGVTSLSTSNVKLINDIGVNVDILFGSVVSAKYTASGENRRIAMSTQNTMISDGAFWYIPTATTNISNITDLKVTIIYTKTT